MPAIPRSGGVRFTTRCAYLTARCPSGCESWLHPRAVHAHLQPGRCRGKPWVEDVEDSALVPEPAAALFIERMPGGLIGPVDVSEDRLRRLTSSGRVRGDVLAGIVVRSPIESVSARRWVYIVTEAVERHGAEAIEWALTSAGFDKIERELDVDAWLVDCPDCGSSVRRTRINLHRTRSTLCRWKRAGAKVRALWQAGWRDPFTVPSAPLKWQDLQAKAVWRRRVRKVDFPLWVAVLLSPGEEHDSSPHAAPTNPAEIPRAAGENWFQLVNASQSDSPSDLP